MHKRIPITNAHMFCRVMHNEDVCRQTLELILGFEIEKIEYQNSEQVIEPSLLTKSVRLDVYAKANGKVYDIEMQNYQMPSLFKRLRYYQGAIDMSSLEKGKEYDLLPDSFIIFICTEDIFSMNLARYDFEITCTNTKKLEVSSGLHWIVLNASAFANAESKELCSFLEYIKTGISGSDILTQRMDKLVNEANADAEWVRTMESVMGYVENAELNLRMVRREAARSVEEAKREAQKEAQEQVQEQVQEQARLNDVLTRTLIEQDRIDDLKLCTEDPEYKQKIFHELGLLQ